MRARLRERLVAGDSDAAARDYIVARYGTFVLLEPPVEPATYLLWFGPGVLLVAALGGVGLAARRRRAGPVPLDAAEQARLAELLGQDGA